MSEATPNNAHVQPTPDQIQRFVEEVNRISAAINPIIIAAHAPDRNAVLGALGGLFLGVVREMGLTREQMLAGLAAGYDKQIAVPPPPAP